MNKRFLTSAAAILLVGASAFSALTFTGCSCTGKGNKTQTTTAASAAQAKTFETKDLLTCESWIGKVTSQVGMEEYVANDRIEIKGKVIYINGKKVKALGANRHESHPVLGHVVPFDHMERDIRDPGSVAGYAEVSV